MTRPRLFLFFAAAAAALSAGCFPIEPPPPELSAAADFSGNLSREGGPNQDLPSSPFLNSFQLRGVLDLTDIEPGRFIVCEKGKDIAVFAFYFYEKDETGAVCSFVFYSRIHQKEDSEQIEISERISADSDKGCLAPGREKIAVKSQTGWSCEDRKEIRQTEEEEASPAEDAKDSGENSQ